MDVFIRIRINKVLNRNFNYVVELRIFYKNRYDSNSEDTIQKMNKMRCDY